MLRITERHRGYSSPGNRNRAIAALHKRGWNHFVCYVDVQSRYALAFAKCDWTTWRYVCR